MSPQNVVSLSSGRESRRGGRASVTLEVVPCDLSLVSEVLLGKYNYPGFGVSSPMFSKNQDSGGSIGPVCGGQQVSSKKWWEKMMISVTVLTSGP